MIESGSTDTALTKRACIVCFREFTDTTTVCPDDGTVLTPLVQDPLIGSVLADRYEILEVIGGGGMGTVYKARHKLMKRVVAIKMLNSQSVSNAIALKRFQQEAQAASALNHPNILTVFDFGLTADGQPFLVMDYLEGTNLGVVLQECGHLSIARVLDISIQACNGLAHAHAKGIIHRDLKPGNIMLIELDKRSDFVKIVDFGIAKLVSLDSDESSHLTTTGEVFGSPLYMSPEQCTGKELDRRSDIYSLGCVLYRALTGISPFTGHDLLECMYKQVNDVPIHFSILCPDLSIPDSLEAIVFKALEKETTKRYQSMDELREALEQLLPDQSQLNTSISSIQSEGNYPVSSTHSSPRTIAQETGSSLSSVVIANTQASLSRDADKSENTKANIVEHFNPRVISALGVLIALLLIGAAILLTMPHKSFPTQTPITKTSPTTSPNSEQNLSVNKLLNDGIAKFNQGNYSSAQQSAMSAFQLTHKLGYKGADYASSVSLLGQIYYAQGAYELARANLQQALPIQEKLYGSQSKEIASTQCELGRVYTALGKYALAEPLLRQSLATREKVLGPQDLSVADSLSGLADLALRQGKFHLAITYLTSALKIREAVLGLESPGAAASLNDLGQAYQLAKNFSEAEELYKRALAIRQTKLAANDPQIANSLICLGSLYAKVNRNGDAIKLFNQALVIQEQAFGLADPTVAKTHDLINHLVQRTRSKGQTHSTNFKSWLAK